MPLLDILVSDCNLKLVADTDSYDFRLSANHIGLDGRSVWMLFDKLFNILVDQMNEACEPLANLEWGKEVARLPTTPYVIWDVVQKGNPEPLPSLDSAAPPPPPEGFVSRQKSRINMTLIVCPSDSVPI